MSDDKAKSAGLDRELINLWEPYEVRDWSETFGVSEQPMCTAVAKVGRRAADVEQALGQTR